jgi:sulfotransferase
MKTFYFLGGLPRSGSTLLCNILAQNPDFFVSKATSGCCEIMIGVRNRWDSLVEHKAEGIDFAQLKHVLNGMLNNYHVTDKSIIIDKSRGWVGNINMLEFILNNVPKILIPVRNLTEIFSSFEKLWRNSAGHTQWRFNEEDFFRSQTIDGRCEILASQSNVVGLPYNRIKDAISRGYKDKLCFIEFDELTSQPENTMRMVYNYLEQPYFNHNFNNVEQVTYEDDIGVHRIPNLHTIRKIVKPVPHDSDIILGQFLVEKYSNLEIWRN